LESVCRGNSTVGSNPTLSASSHPSVRQILGNSRSFAIEPMVERIVIAYHENPPQSARISSRRVTRSRHTHRGESSVQGVVASGGNAAPLEVCALAGGKRADMWGQNAIATRRGTGVGRRADSHKLATPYTFQEGDGHRRVDRSFNWSY
jgi:hypothetical protein